MGGEQWWRRTVLHHASPQISLMSSGQRTKLPDSVGTLGANKPTNGCTDVMSSAVQTALFYIASHTPATSKFLSSFSYNTGKQRELWGAT